MRTKEGTEKPRRSYPGAMASPRRNSFSMLRPRLFVNRRFGLNWNTMSLRPSAFSSWLIAER